MLRKTIILILISIPFSASPASPAPYEWKQLSDGINYTSYSFSFIEGATSTIHAFQIDPKKLKIDVVMAQKNSGGATAQEMAAKNNALLVINGGFFTPAHESIGLIIKDGRELNPIHSTSWWSIFSISNGVPAIYSPKDFKNVKDVKTALQAGPRLVVDGTIPKLKENLAIRSAVGIERDGKVVIAITQGSGISMKELALKMSGSKLNGGFECPNAMGLDGGSSSQLYAKTKKFQLHLPNISRVTNGLAVFAK